jgi:hypothetical protein
VGARRGLAEGKTNLDHRTRWRGRQRVAGPAGGVQVGLRQRKGSAGSTSGVTSRLYAAGLSACGAVVRRVESGGSECITCSKVRRWDGRAEQTQQKKLKRHSPLPTHRASRTVPTERAQLIFRAHLGYRLCRKVKLICQTPAVDQQRLEAKAVMHLDSLSPICGSLCRWVNPGSAAAIKAVAFSRDAIYDVERALYELRRVHRVHRRRRAHEVHSAMATVGRFRAR